MYAGTWPPTEFSPPRFAGGCFCLEAGNSGVLPSFLGLLAAMLPLGFALLLLCWPAVGADGLGLVGFAASLTGDFTACTQRVHISVAYPNCTSWHAM